MHSINNYTLIKPNGKPLGSYTGKVYDTKTVYSQVSPLSTFLKLTSKILVKNDYARDFCKYINVRMGGGGGGHRHLSEKSRQRGEQQKQVLALIVGKGCFIIYES